MPPQLALVTSSELMSASDSISVLAAPNRNDIPPRERCRIRSITTSARGRSIIKALGKASSRCFSASTMPSADQVIGVDLGGTAIKLARFDRQGELLAEDQIPTPQPAMPGAVCMAICEAIERLDPARQAAVVGIGLPGPMDAAARIARVCINLPGGRRCPWRIGWSRDCSAASPSPMMATVPLWVRPGKVQPRLVPMWCCSRLAPELAVV